MEFSKHRQGGRGTSSAPATLSKVLTASHTDLANRSPRQPPSFRPAVRNTSGAPNPLDWTNRISPTTRRALVLEDAQRSTSVATMASNSALTSGTATPPSARGNAAMG
ncbi:unnamed protein product [Phytophthora fragariaefolia]|uniref:Unnamed protein product n=1 Tax=Phytophthora fragariaefolia TaxID=1490495 RepID=A0A9W6WYN7_9STRA|nr:unnamed protein product [Phytophthora fragariaefolia]